jgi:hypothetical protein
MNWIADDRDFLVPIVDLQGRRLQGDVREELRSDLLASDVESEEAIKAFIRGWLARQAESDPAGAVPPCMRRIADDRDFFVPVFDSWGRRLEDDASENLRSGLLASDAQSEEAIKAFVQGWLVRHAHSRPAGAIRAG